MTKRVAIIGAGCSGLAAIKSCLDEGLSPVCFESSNDIGGLWRFSDHVTEDRGSVMSTTIINTSKEMMAFSDFPPPEDFPNFLHHSKVLKYYRLYAKRFNLTNHIRFNCEILRVEPTKSPPLNSNVTSNKGESYHINKNFADNNNNNNNNDDNNNNGTFDCKCSCCCNHQTVAEDSKKNLVNNKTSKESNPKRQNDSQNDDNDVILNSNVINDGKELQISSVADGTRNLNHKRSDGSTSEDKMGGNLLNGRALTDLSCHHNMESFSSERSRSADVSAPSGHWTVVVKDKISGTSTIHRFDAVLICTGHHGQINMPKIQGQNTFKGRILHSRDLRRVDQLQGSRHVVAGIGNSACDVAVELSHRGKVYLSTRRGAWIMQRLQTKGLPADIAYVNRFIFSTLYSLPSSVLNSLVAWALNQKVDHDLYGLRPQHGPIAAHPTVNDELPSRIACGHVTVKTDVERLMGNDVYFNDGTVEKDIDNLVLATGYKMGFPFLDPSLLPCQDNEIPLYLYMFPPHLASPTLAVVGCVQPGGAIGPVAEMQCRLAARVFLGKVQLPSKFAMEKDIQRRREANAHRYVSSPRHTVQVDYIPYIDELASLIGCKPKLGPLLFQDPRLTLQCLFGPCTAYQYRLEGPGQWPGAREAIMTQMERVKCPLSTRGINPLHNKGGQPDHIWRRVVLVLVALTFMSIALVFVTLRFY